MSEILKKIIKNKELIKELSKKYGMREPAVFGSTLKPNLVPNDLDILVRAEEGRSYFDLIDYAESLEELIGIKVDVVTVNSLSPFFKDEILDTAKPVYSLSNE